MRYKTQAKNFAIEFGIPQTEWMLFVIECGLHSGIPKCCVLFYVMFWLDENTETGFSEDRGKLSKYLDMSQNVDNVHPYFACPKCLVEKTFVSKLKKCHCHDEHRRRQDAGEE